MSVYLIKITKIGLIILILTQVNCVQANNYVISILEFDYNNQKIQSQIVDLSDQDFTKNNIITIYPRIEVESNFTLIIIYMETHNDIINLDTNQSGIYVEPNVDILSENNMGIDLRYPFSVDNSNQTSDIDDPSIFKIQINYQGNTEGAISLIVIKEVDSTGLDPIIDGPSDPDLVQILIYLAPVGLVLGGLILIIFISIRNKPDSNIP